MHGQVFHIQRFSLNDGPGIRTTVFCCGCTLECRWCHNPEGRSPTPPLQYLSNKCILCGACATACPQNVHHVTSNGHTVAFSACISCQRCVTACPANALRQVAKGYTPEQLAEEVARDITFFRSNGGVTFSGGEPLMQADFVAESAKRTKSLGVPTVAIDTAGNLPWENFEKVLDVADLFLYDVKAMDASLHQAGTGCDNRLILENLKRLDRAGADLHIRVPVIGGFNDTDAEMQEIAELVANLQNIRQVTLIPFHRLGNEKYVSIGHVSEMERFHEISEDSLRRWSQLFPHRESTSPVKEVDP